MNRNVMLTLSMALVMYIAAPAAAVASPIFIADILVQAGDPNPGGTNQTFSSGQLVGIDAIPSTTVSNGKATATAYVQDGLLGAFAAAQSVIGDSIFVAANARAEFRETLKLRSDSLAVGTPVNLLLTLDFDVVLQATQTPAMGGGCGSFGQGELNFYLYEGPQLAHLEDLAKSAPCPTTTSVPTIVTANIGDELTAILTLNVGAGGRIGFGSSADALHTLRFFADPQGDFFYTTASGNSYLTPQQLEVVPEPTSLVLLGTMIGPLLLARRRARGL